MVKLPLPLLPSIKILTGKPLLAQVSMRVHVRAEREYHSRAYAIRVNGDVTELLISDKDHLFVWINIVHVESIDEQDN